MSSSKTLTPSPDQGLGLLRPTGQLYELQELGKKQQEQILWQEADEKHYDPPPGPPPQRALPPPPPVPPVPTIPQGGERGLRDFNYNGRDIKPRNSERSSTGRHRISSFSLYSNYSSYASSDDGRGGVVGGGGSGHEEAAQVEHVERPPEPNPMMVAAPPPATGLSSRRGVGGNAPPVRQPPPTYASPRQEMMYNRGVRFAYQDRMRREESRDPGAPRVEMAQITGGHSANALWVFACCAFFWYRCLMDEDF